MATVNVQVIDGNTIIAQVDRGISGPQGATGSMYAPRVQSVTASGTSYSLGWISTSYDQINLSNSTASTITLDVDGGSPVDAAKIIFKISTTVAVSTINFTTTGAKSFKLYNTFIPPMAANSVLYIGAIYNAGTSKWDVVSSRYGT